MIGVGRLCAFSLTATAIFWPAEGHANRGLIAETLGERMMIPFFRRLAAVAGLVFFLGADVLAQQNQLPVGPTRPTDRQQCEALGDRYQQLINQLEQQKASCTRSLGMGGFETTRVPECHRWSTWSPRRCAPVDAAWCQAVDGRQSEVSRCHQLVRSHEENERRREVKELREQAIAQEQQRRQRGESVFIPTVPGSTAGAVAGQPAPTLIPLRQQTLDRQRNHQAALAMAMEPLRSTFSVTGANAGDALLSSISPHLGALVRTQQMMDNQLLPLVHYGTGQQLLSPYERALMGTDILQTAFDAAGRLPHVSGPLAQIALTTVLAINQRALTEWRYQMNRANAPDILRQLARIMHQGWRA